MSGPKTHLPAKPCPPPILHTIDAAAIAAAAEALRAGRLVAVPTETVYGLAANASDDSAVVRLYEAKGRPRFNPLIAHVATVAAVDNLAVMTPVARRLANAFWPGPLTLVLEKRDNAPISGLATAGLSTVAVRVPNHPVLHDLLTYFGGAVVAPSANQSGRISATTAEDVAGDFYETDVFAVLDGGPCRLGLESTIIDATGPKAVILRPGAITRDAIAAVVPVDETRATNNEPDTQPTAPGQLRSHYAPRAKLRLDAETPAPDEAFLAFAAKNAFPETEVFDLSPSGDLAEAAANLFRGLRQLDATGAACIAVMPIPETGLGEAINDRLRRAAAPRPQSSGEE